MLVNVTRPEPGFQASITVDGKKMADGADLTATLIPRVKNKTVQYGDSGLLADGILAPAGKPVVFYLKPDASIPPRRITVTFTNTLDLVGTSARDIVLAIQFRVTAILGAIAASETPDTFEQEIV